MWPRPDGGSRAPRSKKQSGHQPKNWKAQTREAPLLLNLDKAHSKSEVASYERAVQWYAGRTGYAGGPRITVGNCSSLFVRLSLNSLASECRPTLRDLTCFGHRTYMLASVTGSGARCAWHHDVSQTSPLNFHQHVRTWLIALALCNGVSCLCLRQIVPCQRSLAV